MPDHTAHQADVDAFNAACPVGSAVTVTLAGRAPFAAVTAGPAEMVGGLRAAVRVAGVKGPVGLECVKPVDVPSVP